MNSENLKKGYIKLFRSVLEHKLFTERREFSKYEAWLDILFGVNYTDSSCLFGNHVFECLRGQSLYSLDTWRERWGWGSKRKVREFFLLLEAQGMISYENLSKTVRITVLNYDNYQSFGHSENENSERTFVLSSSEVPSEVRLESVSKSEHSNATKSDTYKDTRNANGTQTERKRNANGTQTERKSNQVINITKETKEIKENVCELDTHKFSIIDSEIQQLRNDWQVCNDEIKEAAHSLEFLENRVNTLRLGAVANGLDSNEWLAVHEVAVKNYNAYISLYNEKLGYKQQIEKQADFKKKELAALKAKGQYALFSESVFVDKDFFLHKLHLRLKDSGVSVAKNELGEYYERAKSYSTSKLMQSADWVEEVSGWVRKDKVKLKKAI